MTVRARDVADTRSAGGRRGERRMSAGMTPLSLPPCSRAQTQLLTAHGTQWAWAPARAHDRWRARLLQMSSSRLLDTHILRQLLRV
eukprot:2252932-Pleurochrysis_carterae.AAC.1